MTRAVFRDLVIWMVGFGLLTGVAFPFFVVALGVDTTQALTPSFFVATLLAGLLVGAVNWCLARLVLGTRLRALSAGMQRVAAAVAHATDTGDWSGCAEGGCRLAVDSQDELGDSARSFNGLVSALERSHHVETSVRELLRILSSHLELEQLADAALGWIIGAVEANAGALLLNRGGALRAAATRGAIDSNALCAAPSLRDAMSAPLGRARTPADDGAATAVRLVPIISGDNALGVVALAGTLAPSVEAERILELFARALAVPLTNALIHARSLDLARTDALTGCVNRGSGLAPIP